MEVKIYREPENTALLLDEEQLIEYNALISELGISGAPATPNKVPSVYIPLNTVQKRTLQEICRATVGYKEYKRSTIPVEVLRVIKLAEDHKMFDFIEIWFDEKNLDPMVVGKSYRSESDRKNEYSWNMNDSLIARWGEAALEFEALLALGFERGMQRMKDEAKSLLMKCQNFLAEPETFTRKALDDGEPNYKRLTF